MKFAKGLGVLIGLVNGLLTRGMRGVVLSAATLLVGKARVPLKAPEGDKFVFGPLLGGSSCGGSSAVFC
jgi:hypothetical protein